MFDEMPDQDFIYLYAIHVNVNRRMWYSEVKIV